MRRRLVIVAAVVALGAVVTAGLLQSSGATEPGAGKAPSPSELRELLAGAPAPLARLHARPNQLLDADSATAELASLKGYPVVVNKWASWCGPCRAEFPAFQEVSAELGKQVAFLGLNAGDGPKPAAEFLKGYPTSFPSISDPQLEVSQRLGIAGAWPTTAFFDAEGKQTYIHQGPYLDADDLRADIAKYTRG